MRKVLALNVRKSKRNPYVDISVHSGRYSVYDFPITRKVYPSRLVKLPQESLTMTNSIIRINAACKVFSILALLYTEKKQAILSECDSQVSNLDYIRYTTCKVQPVKSTLTAWLIWSTYSTWELFHSTALDAIWLTVTIHRYISTLSISVNTLCGARECCCYCNTSQCLLPLASWELEATMCGGLLWLFAWLSWTFGDRFCPNYSPNCPVSSQSSPAICNPPMPSKGSDRMWILTQVQDLLIYCSTSSCQIKGPLQPYQTWIYGFKLHRPKLDKTAII